MLKVTLYFREPRKTGHSIEGIFKTVNECLKNKIEIHEFYCDAHASRLKNIINAPKYSSEVNHITGDVQFLALGFGKKKVLLTIHDLGYYENKSRSYLKRMIYGLFWFYLPLKKVSLVTVISEFVKEKLLEYYNFPEDKIRVIPNPLKRAFQYSEKKQMNAVPVVLMIGTGKHKNLDNLLEAARGTHFFLNIVGFPAKDELQKLKEYKIPHSITNIANEQQMLEKYKECDILFMASLYEGFGMPIIEAQSVGRPVITSNIAAMKETGKDSAIMVDPYNVAEIRDALYSLLDWDYYNEIVRKGRKNAEKYHADTIAEKYLAVYQELAMM